MAGTGGFRKGAGRKSKASKLIEAGFVASWFTAEFQEIKWKSLVDSKDERVSLDAIKYLSDQMFGKPSQFVDLNHSGALDLVCPGG
jgi:hypothetical protein